ncbi:hypothetical protein Rhe02_15320 [Rhizocola hellebori]|uniref:Ankyrin repeat domain-containing protein n=1 Tax=Rhizocola hellebori TaxID=1392758 RepID=A0A8J3Q437_9ACTN|nr:ankyrin repeat domain-containing protein [Rhizocola hellebori]GIH03465.1 hypothetical protein Rhe02_15320 [Rhizocola hellebori]
MTVIDPGDPRAVSATDAIQKGDLEALRTLLTEHPELAVASLGSTDEGGMSRTLLHVATDWPGNFPNGAATVVLLIEAGADVNARFTGPHTETPLHWAASSDDVAVLDVLLDGGADIEAAGAVIGGGTALDDAVAFAQWNAARRLVERGANVSLFNAAALGLDGIVNQQLAAAGEADITRAFWGACHGGQRQTAEHLLGLDADRNWIAEWDGHTPLDAARRNGFDELAQWLVTQDCQGVKTRK